MAAFITFYGRLHLQLLSSFSLGLSFEEAECESVIQSVALHVESASVHLHPSAPSLSLPVSACSATPSPTHSSLLYDDVYGAYFWLTTPFPRPGGRAARRVTGVAGCGGFSSPSGGSSKWGAEMRLILSLTNVAINSAEWPLEEGARTWNALRGNDTRETRKNGSASSTPKGVISQGAPFPHTPRPGRSSMEL